jgi:dTMP kinase
MVHAARSRRPTAIGDGGSGAVRGKLAPVEPERGFKRPEDLFFAPACLIAIVGLDGAGKTSQASRLVAAIQATGIRAALLPNQTQAPMKVILEEIAEREARGGYLDLVTPDAMRLASTMVKVLDFARVLGSEAEARATVMVADRYAVCQYAAARAQGATNEPLLRKISAFLPEPDITILLDVSPEEAHRRINARGLDAEDLAFLRRYRSAYLSLPEAPSFRVVDGDADPDLVADRLMNEVVPVLRECGLVA